MPLASWELCIAHQSVCCLQQPWGRSGRGEWRGKDVGSGAWPLEKRFLLAFCGVSQWKCTWQQKWPQEPATGELLWAPALSHAQERSCTLTSPDACSVPTSYICWHVVVAKGLCPNQRIAVGLSPAIELKAFFHDLDFALSVWRGATTQTLGGGNQYLPFLRSIWDWTSIASNPEKWT